MARAFENITTRYVGESLKDFTHADHLAGPLFIALVLKSLLLWYRTRGDLGDGIMIRGEKKNIMVGKLRRDEQASLGLKLKNFVLDKKASATASVHK